MMGKWVRADDNTFVNVDNLDYMTIESYGYYDDWFADGYRIVGHKGEKTFVLHDAESRSSCEEWINKVTGSKIK